MGRVSQVVCSLGAAAAFIGPLPTGAQRRPDMVLNKAVATMAQATASRRALMLGVECLLDQRPSNVRSFLKMYPDSKDGMRAADYLNAGDCVDGQAGSQAKRFGPTMLRGAIYKAMYQRAYSGGASQLRDTYDFAGDAVGQLEASASAYVAARKFGECVVRHDPVAARALVLSEVESDAEMAALHRLVPSYDACAVKDHVPMTRAGLTGVVAEVLYRLSKPGSGKNA